MTINKTERFREFIDRLSHSPAMDSELNAFNLIADTLNNVEDEFTNILYSPNKWTNDGRMYPPLPDSKRPTSDPKVVRYRSRSHNTYIGDNGAIRIEKARGEKLVVLDKEGIDKRKVGDL